MVQLSLPHLSGEGFSATKTNMDPHHQLQPTSMTFELHMKQTLVSITYDWLICFAFRHDV